MPRLAGHLRRYAPVGQRAPPRLPARGTRLAGRLTSAASRSAPGVAGAPFGGQVGQVPAAAAAMGKHRDGAVRAAALPHLGQPLLQHPRCLQYLCRVSAGAARAEARAVHAVHAAAQQLAVLQRAGQAGGGGAVGAGWRNRRRRLPEERLRFSSGGAPLLQAARDAGVRL